MGFLDNFRLGDEKEDFHIVSENIHDGIEFKGTNLWILIFAIFIASLGLNLNSTAVIIGAMLVSPLMGPIIGLGFGMAINDLVLLKKAVSSYLFSALIGLITSTIYFLLSPINQAHSEILARTSPNIYDVLIALMGGFAGFLAVSSKLKGNVIPGVAIATAIMPPLCTAGYGLATQQFPFFFGALYLFLINTVFIALATLVTTRYLNFPYKKFPTEADGTRVKRIVWIVTIVTVIPSVYFGYDMVKQNKYETEADLFIKKEAAFPNDYLLQKTIDAKNRTITLTYGGQIIEDTNINVLKSKLALYNLSNTKLTIQQGFAYLENKKKEDQPNPLTFVLSEKDMYIQQLQLQIDSIKSQNKFSKQLYLELKTQYPNISSCIVQNAVNQTDTSQQKIWIALINSTEKWENSDKSKINDWLKVRMQLDTIYTYYQ
jgi:uncharacterized hydrophobic protein (TIGR00271 family)